MTALMSLPSEILQLIIEEVVTEDVYEMWDKRRNEIELQYVITSSEMLARCNAFFLAEVRSQFLNGVYETRIEWEWCGGCQDLRACFHWFRESEKLVKNFATKLSLVLEPN